MKFQKNRLGSAIARYRHEPNDNVRLLRLGNLLELTNVGALRSNFISLHRFALSLAEAESTLLKKTSAIKFDVKDEIYLILRQI